MLSNCVLVGLDWAEPMMQFPLHVTCSCIPMHTYSLFNIFWYMLFWDFSNCLFLPPYSLVYVNASWHLNVSLLHPETLFVSGHLLLLIPPPLLFGSVMRMPKRTSLWTFLDKAFIRNAESFCQTSPTLTYLLSFTVGVGSHYVTSWSFVHPYWSRSFTPTCMDLIIQYLFLLLTFEVHALWSHWFLYLMCSVSWG